MKQTCKGKPHPRSRRWGLVPRIGRLVHVGPCRTQRRRVQARIGRMIDLDLLAARGRHGRPRSR